MRTFNIGGHLSLGRSPDAVVRRAAENGFGSMQIFASSPGAWKPPIIDGARIQSFVRARRECGVDPLFVHAIYLINLASENALLVDRSQRSLVDTLEAADAIGAQAVVTHLGSHGGRGFDTVARLVADRLSEVADSAGGRVFLALENSAGSGGIIGSTVQELGHLIAQSAWHPRLKIALDTAHLCGSGWDFSLPGTAKRLVAEVGRHVGMERLVVVHSNDSKAPCGSRKDRHANIGDGCIGIEGFRCLVEQRALQKVPWILETPGIERRVADRTKLQELWLETQRARVKRHA